MDNNQNSAYNELLKKLDAFIRKYYTDQLLRGILLFFGLALGYFIAAILLDYFFEYSVAGRSVLFYSFIGTLLAAAYFWIITPILKIYRLGKVLSYAQASLIVGAHFEDVRDKVLNTLQLYDDLSQQANKSLALASLNQRIEVLNPVPFNNAIDLTKNRKYLRYALPPFLALLVMLLASPRFLSEGTERLFNPATEMEKKAPFQFVLLNKNLNVPEGTDLLVKLELKGEEIPEYAYIESEGYQFRMEKAEKRVFTYLLKNITKEQSIRFKADDYYSKSFTITTIPNPSLLNFDLDIEYPVYTGKTNQKVSNNGDLSVPEGSKLRWIFSTKNTEELEIVINDSLIRLKPEMDQHFSFNLKANESFRYYIRATNNKLKAKDSLAYFVNVVPDAYPVIAVQEEQDTISRKRKYFIGDVSDDYGLSRLTFNYRFIHGGDSVPEAKTLQIVPIPVNTKAAIDEFIYYWDMSFIPIQPGDQIEYFFQVWDNDGVNGSKSSRTSAKVFKAPTEDELKNETASNNKEIKDELSKALSETKKLQKEMKKMQTDLLNQKQMTWQDKAKMQNLLDQQLELQKKIDNLKQKNENNNFQKSEFQEMDPELLEKQKQLEELFEQLMTDEMKKLFEELQELLDEMNKDKVQEKLDQIQKSDEELKKELDRALEQFKQTEFQEKLTDIIEKSDELAKEQEKLAEETKEKTLSNEELKKEQEKLNEEFKKLQEDIRELEKLNEDLENKHELLDTKQKEDEIASEQQKSQENLQQNQNKKASESQKKASEKMKEMSEQLSAMQLQMQQESIELDMAAIRALLENLVTLSFDQEKLMEEFKTVTTKDAKYVKLGQQQRKLRDDMRMIQDSLDALSKRIPEPRFQAHVSNEVRTINENMDLAIGDIGERRTNSVRLHQQTSMTSVNNLTLILSEMLDALQQQSNSQNSQPGSGSCKKPGGNGKPSSGNKPSGKPGEKPGFSPGKSGDAQSIREMQESLTKQLEELKKQLENGKKDGKNPGNNGKNGSQGNGMSKQLAETAAMQEALRRKLMDLANDLNKKGNGIGDDFKKIADEMEKIEEDLVNKRVNHQTLKRQQDIMTRLLESEKAMREREFDNERKSNEAKDEELGNSLQFLEYKRKKEKEVELLRTIPASLQPYYKNKVNDYFNLIR